jgi:tetratricopeptide (TPR) repeat protein
MRTALTLAFSLVSLTASAQVRSVPTAPTAPSTAVPATTPARSGHEMTPFQAALFRGSEAYRQQQYDPAAVAFREAATLNARSAVPQLFLGYVARAKGESANALGRFREAARIAQAEGDDPNRGRALQAIASLYEGQGNWAEARTAWTEYATFGDAHPTVTYPAVGRTRIEVIGQRDTVEREVAPVRERIAERLRVNATNQAQQPGAASPSR